MIKKRIKMRFKLEATQVISNRYPLRKLTANDKLKLSKTMLAAYIGSVDYQEETIEEAILEIEKTLNDGYGPFIPDASFLIEKDDEICAAILINLWQSQPLITEVFVGKSYRCQGMASTLIKTSMHELLLLGYKEIILYVTLENYHAVKLYEKLGFEKVD